MQNWGHNIQAFGNKLPKYLKWLGVGTTVVGGAIKGIGDIFGGHKKSSKKASNKKKTTKKQATYISKQKKLLRQFNAMLDKAEKVIALAKSGGDSSDSSVAGDVDGSHERR